ncbi:MAG: DUF2845 domain-containing protein [Anaeromyxobacteraceae bacterium]
MKPARPLPRALPRRGPLLRGLLLCSLALAPAARADDSMRCERGIVSAGDLTVDLLGKCGPPSLRDRWTEEQDAVAVNVKAGLAEAARLTVELEQWTYDFGTNSFLMLVTLRNGRIVGFARGGYGHGLPPVEAPRPRVSACEPNFHEGDTKADVLARCGQPADLHAWQGVRSLPLVATGTGAVGVSRRPVRHEQWIYNLGPNQFLRVVLFEDGRVASVSTGGYGYRD